MGAATSDTTQNDWPAVVGMPYEEFIEVVDLPNRGPCVRLTRQEAANALFYHDCSTEDQDWAWERLSPLPLAPALETFHLPNFWTPRYPATTSSRPTTAPTPCPWTTPSWAASACRRP